MNADPINSDAVKEFIRAYTPADEPRIRFNWNGKHAEEFADPNMKFRDAVREAVLEDVSAVPLDLVRDLFRAETQCSREAWGINHGIGELAENLLRRGGTNYLDDYLEGKSQSFDAWLGTTFEYDLVLARTMLGEVKERLRIARDSSKASLWERGEKLFADWIADCEKRRGEPPGLL